MPGSVQNAVPATVLPQSLCRAFIHSREYPVLGNEYRNGEAQFSAQATSSRKRWDLAKRLTPPQLAVLRNFYLARKGPLESFYFYDPFEPAAGQPIGSNYDPTGLNTPGRYVVRFDGPWSESVGLGRADVSVTLIELA